ncbi:hypothetical protein HELRODRAFT_162124 [Helobdella robusta]|uniref:Doublecortin domain-containing protein n=1 Tax=Helobdella robusta TaxID=6412 RepID=T1ES95_HELRO|nr:hypothetical protein HELRODRAFT_162124 [Helobdella robusta]ESN98673.1 hypothetical protein HELRODRAFT_162124 [Helobdella robusta]
MKNEPSGSHRYNSNDKNKQNSNNKNNNNAEKSYYDFSRADNNNNDDDDVNSPPSTSNNFNLTHKPPSKPSYKSRVCHFYSDNNDKSGACKIVVNTKSFPNIDSLKSELTKKIEGLPFGVRKIFTPRCRNEVQSLENLKSEGHYVCTSSNKPPTSSSSNVLVNRTMERRVWYPNKRRLSGSKELKKLVSNDELHRFNEKSITYNRSGETSTRSNQQLMQQPLQQHDDHGRVTICLFGSENNKKCQVVLDKRNSTLNDLLRNLSIKFKLPIYKIIDSDGTKIQVISELFQKDGRFVAVPNDKLSRSLSNLSQDSSRQTRRIPFNEPQNNKISQFKKASNPIEKEKDLYRITVKTNELSLADYLNKLTITIYGDLKTSVKFDLMSSLEEKKFKKNSLDVFEFRDRPIGEPFKIRLEIDESVDGMKLGWYCDEVTVRLNNSEQLLYHFPCRRWLSRQDDDWQLYREVPALHKMTGVLPVVIYRLSVSTGDVWRGGTNRDVLVKMIGECGDTGWRVLRHPYLDKPFVMAMTTVFNVEAVMLGNIRNMLIKLGNISHNKNNNIDEKINNANNKNVYNNNSNNKKTTTNKQKIATSNDESWFLDEIVISCSIPHVVKWIFRCYE